MVREDFSCLLSISFRIYTEAIKMNIIIQGKAELDWHVDVKAILSAVGLLPLDPLIPAI